MSAPARAALAGNPSDGFGGATLAVALADFAAQVTLRAAPRTEVHPPAAEALVRAAVRRFAVHAGGPEPRVVVRVASTIPREVGLGGSSAIVVATLRALGHLCDVDLPPAVLPSLALAVETEEMGIAAGPQDRVIQVHGGLLLMDFAGGRTVTEPLDPALLPPLYLAHRPDSAQPSGAVHGDLRARFARGDPAARAALTELATVARAARDALLARDAGAFAAAIDASFDLRRRLLPLDPRHAQLVATARSVGAAANYAGSGGAIVGTIGEDAGFDALQTALAAQGATVLRPAVAPGQVSGRGATGTAVHEEYRR